MPVSTSIPSVPKGSLPSIMFASCNNAYIHASRPSDPDLGPTILRHSLSHRPAAFVWGGDAIYGDVMLRTGESMADDPESQTPASMRKRVRRSAATAERLNSHYDFLLEKTNWYPPLGVGHIFGTVDDHDMGDNNAGSDFKLAANGDSGKAFRRFLDGSNRKTAEFRRLKDDERGGSTFVKEGGDPSKLFVSELDLYAGKRKGVYGVKVFDFDTNLLHHEDFDTLDPSGRFPAFPGIDPLSSSSSSSSSTPPPRNKKVAVFTLDCRTFKSPYLQGLDSFTPSILTTLGLHSSNYSAVLESLDFLGPEQWSWFSSALRSSDAEVNIVVNGLQALPSLRAPSGHLGEDWEKFPAALRRLQDELLSSGARAPLLVTGDVHMSQLFEVSCSQQGGAAAAAARRSRPLREVTTSGITHSWGQIPSPVAYHRGVWYAPYVTFAARTIMEVGHAVMPWNEIMYKEPMQQGVEATPSSRRQGKDGLQYALELNFGSIAFDFHTSTLNVDIFGIDGDKNGPLLSANWSFDELSGGVPSALPRLPRLWESSSSPPPLSSSWACVPARGGSPPLLRVVAGYAVSYVVIFSLAMPAMALTFLEPGAVGGALLMLLLLLLCALGAWKRARKNKRESEEKKNA